MQPEDALRFLEARAGRCRLAQNADEFLDGVGRAIRERKHRNLGVACGLLLIGTLERAHQPHEAVEEEKYSTRHPSIVLLIGVLITGSLILLRGSRGAGVTPPGREPLPTSRPATAGRVESPSTNAIGTGSTEEPPPEFRSFAAARARMAELVSSIPLDVELASELRGLIDYWALADLERVWQFLSEIENFNVRGELQVRVVNKLAGKDIHLAFDKALLLAGGNSHYGRKAIRNVGYDAELSEMDDLMEKAGSRTNRGALFMGFLSQQEEFAAARDLIKGPHFESLRNDNRDEALSFAGRLLAEEDPTTALDRFRDIPEGWGVASVASGFTSEWAGGYRDDRKKGAEMLRSRQGEEVFAPVFTNYYHQWLREDPNTALRSATELSENLRHQLIPGMVASWLGRDSMAVGREVRKWEPGPVRDRAIEGIVEFLIGTDARTEAEEWVESISDEKTRLRLMEEFGDP